VKLLYEIKSADGKATVVCKQCRKVAPKESPAAAEGQGEAPADAGKQ
jgi:hypothetical protein